MKAICAFAVFLFVIALAPKPQRANLSHAHAFLGADPIPICPMKNCPTVPAPPR